MSGDQRRVTLRRRSSLGEFGTRRLSFTSIVAEADEQGFATSLSPARHTTLFLFSCLSFLMAGTWMGLAPITNVAAEAWGVSVSAVNQISLAMLFAFPVSTSAVAAVVEVHGVRVCLVASTLVNTGALAVRLAVQLSQVAPQLQFAVTLLTQLVACFSDAASLNLSARVASDWWPANQRDRATTVATMSNVLGQMVALLVSPRLVTSPSSLPRLWITLLIPNVALCIFMFVWYEERPPFPPSTSAMHQWRERDDEKLRNDGLLAGFASFLRKTISDTKLLVENRNFAYLTASFAVGTGTVWAVLILEAQFLLPCGYSNSLIGAAGASLIGAGEICGPEFFQRSHSRLSGLFTAFGVSMLMESTHAYVEIQRSVMVAALAATVCVVCTLRPDHPVPLFCAWCFLGATLQPLMPLTLEHAAELTFPVDPNVSTSALFLAANAFGYVLSVVLGFILSLPSGETCRSGITPVDGIIMALMTTGAGLAFAVQKDARRSSAEAQSLLGH
jgi:FLVCR family MFS transporter 7